MEISKYIYIYFGLWVSAICSCAVLICLRPQSFEFISKKYWQFLAEPWKISFFLLATAAITCASPFSGDPTWDVPDSILISILTFVTAPWAIAIFYKSASKLTFSKKTWVAFCLFWIPCWAYDFYILFRDGNYPPTWWTNLIISGGICFAAGLFWNLAWDETRGTYFAFYLDEWPEIKSTPFIRIAIFALLISIPVVFAVSWFVWNYLFPHRP